MYKILVVDDSRLVTSMIEERFETDKRFQLFVADSMATTLKLLEEHQDFFAAVLDLILPDCAVGELVDKVIAKKIPTIVLTSKIDDETRSIMMKKPIVDYVMKNSPYDFDYIKHLIDRLAFFKGKKALIVDDSSTMRNLVSYFFKTLLLEPYTAASAQEALKVLEENKNIAVAIIDYMMPNMNGASLIQAIRKNALFDRLVIIGFTSQENLENSANFLKAGADDFLEKPFTKEQFNFRIIRSMRISEQYEKLTKALTVINKYIPNFNCDKDGLITFANQSLLSLAGFEKSELVGKNISVLLQRDGKSVSLEPLFAKLCEKGKLHEELEIKTKEGACQRCEADFDLLLDSQEQIYGVSIIINHTL